MALRHAGLAPLLSCTFGVITFATSYAIAVGNGHVVKWLPYIGDTAAISPESCIFAQLFNISMFFLAVTVFLLHFYTFHYYTNVLNVDVGGWEAYSFCNMCVGMLAALGGSVAANFQESRVRVVHDIGVYVFFIACAIYFWGQICVTYGLRPKPVSAYVPTFRLVLAGFCSALVVFHLVCLFARPFVKTTSGGGAKPTPPSFPDNVESYKYGDALYTNWLLTTISEWVLALVIMISIGTYSYDLYNLNDLKEQLDEQSTMQEPLPADEVFYSTQIAPLTVTQPPYAGSLIPRVKIEPMEIPTTYHPSYSRQRKETHQSSTSYY